MKMLLLVSAVALLVIPAHIQASDWIKRNAIYDQVEKCKKSLTEVRTPLISTTALPFIDIQLYLKSESNSFFLYVLQDIFVESVSNLTQGRDKCGVSRVFLKH